MRSGSGALSRSRAFRIASYCGEGSGIGCFGLGFSRRALPICEITFIANQLKESYPEISKHGQPVGLPSPDRG